MNRGCNTLVHDGFLEWAESKPERAAVLTNTESISFGDLSKRCVAIASMFDRQQVSTVGLCQPNSLAVIEVFFATLMAGGCVYLFDPSWPHNVLEKLLRLHGPDILVAPIQKIKALGDNLQYIRGMTAEDINYLANQKPETSMLQCEPRPDTPFLLGFTSGTSGLPKAFIRTHQTWIESFRHSTVELETKANDIVIAPGPLSHGLSLYAVIEALSVGASVILQTEFDANTVLSSVRTNNASVLVVVPSILDVLIEKGAQQVYPSIIRIITAGAKLPSKLRNDMKPIFPNADIIEYYGASELSFLTVAKASEDCPPNSVGRPFSGVDIALRNPSGDAVDNGQVGIIWVKSKMLIRGYVGPTDGSGFRTDGAWGTVGDLGHFDADGFLYLDGREGSIITSAGYTVYPSGIELVLLSHPSVKDAAVLGLPDARWGEIIAAVVVLKARPAKYEEDLIAYCKAQMEPYACPRRWQFVQSLSRTASGKVKRSRLMELFREKED
ncbi:MAG: AMP-binding protein [Rhodospirillaceae bacterium]